MEANHFLGSLSPADLDLLRSELESVELERDEEIAREGRRITHVYFPLKSIVSVIIMMRDGRQVESRTIGRESGVGLLHALGSLVSYERVIVQVAGPACRLPVKTLAEAVRSSPSLLEEVARHAQSTIVQSAQATACNALHDVEGRMCRWLLMTQDRLMSSLLPLTQEHLSIMLGVQRTTVTAVAQELQEAGLISYSRGKIRVLSREGLQRRACECYAAIENAAALLVGEPEPGQYARVGSGVHA
jgi:CRP-like cAMP-binding protein